MEDTTYEELVAEGRRLTVEMRENADEAAESLRALEALPLEEHPPGVRDLIEQLKVMTDETYEQWISRLAKTVEEGGLDRLKIEDLQLLVDDYHGAERVFTGPAEALRAGLMASEQDDDDLL